MTEIAALAEVNIHLRARSQDRDIIDRAAQLVGANRSQFMMASALKEARTVLLDQSTLHVDARAFERIMDWIDAEPSEGKAAGLNRLLLAAQSR